MPWTAVIIIFRQVCLFIVFLSVIFFWAPWSKFEYLTIWPWLTTCAYLALFSRAQCNSRIIKKAFLLMSSAKVVTARSPRVTWPLIGIRRVSRLWSHRSVCVPVCVSQEWPYAVVWWMEMSRCGRRHLEAGGNSEEGEGGRMFHHIIVFWGIVAWAAKHKRL